MSSGSFELWQSEQPACLDDQEPSVLCHLEEVGTFAARARAQFDVSVGNPHEWALALMSEGRLLAYVSRSIRSQSHTHEAFQLLVEWSSRTRPLDGITAVAFKRLGTGGTSIVSRTMLSVERVDPLDAL